MHHGAPESASGCAMVVDMPGRNPLVGVEAAVPSDVRLPDSCSMAQKNSVLFGAFARFTEMEPEYIDAMSSMKVIAFRRSGLEEFMR